MWFRHRTWEADGGSNVQRMALLTCRHLSYQFHMHFALSRNWIIVSQVGINTEGSERCSFWDLRVVLIVEGGRVKLGNIIVTRNVFQRQLPCFTSWHWYGRTNKVLRSGVGRDRGVWMFVIVCWDEQRCGRNTGLAEWPLWNFEQQQLYW